MAFENNRKTFQELAFYIYAGLGEDPVYNLLLFMIQDIPVSVILAKVCSHEISVHIFNSLIPCLIPFPSQKGTTPNITGGLFKAMRTGNSLKTGSLFQTIVVSLTKWKKVV